MTETCLVCHKVLEDKDSIYCWVCENFFCEKCIITDFCRFDLTEDDIEHAYQDNIKFDKKKMKNA